MSSNIFYGLGGKLILESKRFLKFVHTQIIPGVLRFVYAGYQNVMAQKSDGTTYSWGYNVYGQIGDNTVNLRETPIRLTKSFNKLSIGYQHSGGIDSNGQVWCWGLNGNGQLGDGTILSKNYPTVIYDATKFCNINAAYEFSLSIDKDGRAWAWGNNLYFQLGTNLSLGSYLSNPTLVYGNKTFCHISGGYYHTIGIDYRGKAWGWGANYLGQVGMNSVSYRICTPFAVCGNHTFCKISTGYDYSISLDNNGKVWGWGTNASGQLGQNNTICYSTPVAIYKVYTFCKISLGKDNNNAFSLSLDNHGRGWFWGSAISGGLPPGNLSSKSVPFLIYGNHTFCQICGGVQNSYGIDNIGKTWAWGQNSSGSLGDNTIVQKYTPVAVCGNHTFCSISAFYHAISIDNRGQAWGWGYNMTGQLGNNSIVAESTPVAVCGNHTFCSISAYRQSLVIDNRGQVWGWGYNSHGELGINSTVSHSTPILINNHTFCKISAGDLFSLGIDYKGKIWGWGYNGYGQLGIEDGYPVSTPVAICGYNKTFCSITAGGSNSFGIDKDNNLWGWGKLTTIGNGSSSLNTKTPVSFILNKTFCSIALGSFFSFGIDNNSKVWIWGLAGSNVLYLPSLFKSNIHTFCQITSGDNYSINIDNHGQAWGWGYNYTGQLGNNENFGTYYTTPVAVCGNHTFCSISILWKTSFGLDQNGKAWGWGYNSSGQLGDNSTTNQCTPIAVCGNHTFCSISTNFEHTLAKDYLGKVWAWGRNDFGPLGTNSLDYYSTPVAVYGNHTFCKVSTGDYHSLGLDGNGKLWSWGLNASGQLGINSVDNQSTPIAVLGNHTFCSIFGAYGFSMAVDYHGKLWSWGTNNSGQLGNNNYDQYNTPISVLGNHTFCSISTYSQGVMGLDNHNRIWSWGDNQYGKLGIKVISITPILISTNVTSVVTGYHTLTLNNKSMWGWGYNTKGEIGDNTTTSRCTPVFILGGEVERTFCKISAYNNISSILDKNGKAFHWGYMGPKTLYKPEEIQGTHTFCSIGTGSDHEIGLDNRGVAWGWGYNSVGQLGINIPDDGEFRSTPMTVYGNHTFCKISAGNGSSLALDNHNKMWGWGYSEFLGKMTIIPLPIEGSNRTFCLISAGYTFSSSIDNRNKAWTWGNNQYGQLGVNSISNLNHYTPVSVFGNHNFTTVLASSDPGFALGLDISGKTWGWGYNYKGQLGDNTVTNKSTPVAVNSVYHFNNHTFCSISSGNFYTLGIDNHGKAWGWGYNNVGQLGVNSLVSYSTPVAVCGNHTFCSISAGLYNSSLGIDNRGEAWGWGYNFYGNLGDNSTISKSTPILVHGNHTFCSISSDVQTIAIDNRGQAWGWGYNYRGELGNNSTDNYSTPIAVCGSHTFCKISISIYNSSLAIDNIGQAWTWGYNNWGQLGDNNMGNDQSTPVAVCGNHTFTYISSLIALDNVGQAWAWGYNNYGRLGNNSDLAEFTPVAVCGNHTFCKISSSQHSLGIDNNGKSWGWGYNDWGQVGNNTGFGSTCTPLAVCNNKVFVYINTGYESSFGIDISGKAWSWGYNNKGQLGINSIACKSIPIVVSKSSPIEAKVCFISIGNKNSMSLDNYGKAWGWGYNNYGQLGNNNIIEYSTPIAVSGNHTFCKINTGSLSMALDYNGKAWGWGYNTNGQIGDNSVTCRSTPVAVAGLNKTFCKISIKVYQSFGLDYNGKGWSWGWNSYGQLGINSVSSRRTPTAILGSNKTFCEISAGSYHTIALDYNGKAWGWGYNTKGELGNNSLINQCTPVAVCGNHTFCSISAGYKYTLAIDKDGKSWSWGYNINGKLGINPYVITPILVSNSPFNLASVGRNHSLSLDNNGGIYSWGYNSNAQLGNKSINPVISPTYIIGGVPKIFCQIGTGTNFSLGVTSNGKTWGWGLNTLGQLGDNSIISRITPVLIQGTTKTFCFISSGQNHSISLDFRGKVWAWGTNVSGQLGDSSVICKSTPVAVLGTNKTFCQISAGFAHSAALDNGGKIWSWGYNIYGQLGDNSRTSRLTPVTILGVTKTFCQIACGAYHTVVIDFRGRAWGWGYNINGQLGVNSIISYSTPVAILGANKTFCYISAGSYISLAVDYTNNVWGWGSSEYLGIDKVSIIPEKIGGNKKTFSIIGSGPSGSFSLALDYNGKSWSWGINTNGQLGDNNVILRCTPVAVLGIDKTFCKIHGNGNTSLAINNRGRIFGWGLNGNGQIGNNSITSVRTPVSILGAIKTFCYIAVGNTHSTSIDKNGKIWSWGLNGNGQLGNNSITSVRTPVSILGANKTFCYITAGNNYCSSIDFRGKIWSWGINTTGQLGNRSTTSVRTPVSIGGSNKTFCSISAGATHNIAIDNRGKVWAWGAGTSGQLGDNNGSNNCTPVAVFGNRTFCKIAGGGTTSYGVDFRGQVWAWGAGTSGQIGNGLTDNKYTPTAIFGTKTMCSILAGSSHAVAIDYRGQVWAWGLNTSGQLGYPQFILTPILINI